MRDELKAALQARWEESLRERAALDPQPAVPALDGLLAPIRDQLAEANKKLIKESRGRGRKNLASQIPPNNGSESGRCGLGSSIRPLTWPFLCVWS
jgi:hypothetical protein